VEARVRTTDVSKSDLWRSVKSVGFWLSLPALPTMFHAHLPQPQRHPICLTYSKLSIVSFFWGQLSTDCSSFNLLSWWTTLRLCECQDDSVPWTPTDVVGHDRGLRDAGRCVTVCSKGLGKLGKHQSGSPKYEAGVIITSQRHTYCRDDGTFGCIIIIIIIYCVVASGT
jgi:hypothetical protein